MTRIFNSDFLIFFWFIFLRLILLGSLSLRFLCVLDKQRMLLRVMEFVLGMLRVINSNLFTVRCRVFLRMMKVMMRVARIVYIYFFTIWQLMLFGSMKLVVRMSGIFDVNLFTVG